MAEVANAIKKTVADPIAAYVDILPLWTKSRAACKGQREIKRIDRHIDVLTFTNLLIPFSPSMTQQQFEFYKSEAEWPGIVAQYAKTLVGGLLRKQPTLELPKDVNKEAFNWIINEFGQDSSPLTHFLDEALWEEVQTSSPWVYVDYPRIANPDAMTKADYKKLKPYPVLWAAEAIINWTVETTTEGKSQLTRIIMRGFSQIPNPESEFHPVSVDTIWVHEVVEQQYRIRIFNNQQTADGKGSDYVLVDTVNNIMVNNKPLDFIPAWPLNGSYTKVDPILLPLVDREIALYNKISRRNHLLYGAATYTPVISSDMSDDDFDLVVSSGLGSWIKLKQGDTATILDTPTAALADMDRAIASAVEDMAKLGIRMLSPESAQSGVALEIRNASQTAQLGTLNTKISNTMSNIICFMLNWRYDLQLKPSDVIFTLSADFNPTPLGADWLRLATEWYQSGLIPRTAWLIILKQNDMLDPEYDDKKGVLEINADDLIVTKTDEMDFANNVAKNQSKLNKNDSSSPLN